MFEKSWHNPKVEEPDAEFAVINTFLKSSIGYKKSWHLPALFITKY
jgi:hypothetical protein